jgi:hypothetical protein
MPRSGVKPFDKFVTQFKAVKEAAAAAHVCVKVQPPEAETDGSIQPDYVYQEGVLLCRPTDEEGRDLRDVISGNAPVAEFEAVADGRLLKAHLRKGESARKAMEDLDLCEPHRRPRGLPLDSVTHNHVVSICHVSLCPADEPYPVPPGVDPQPPLGELDAGLGVRIDIIDTGLDQQWTSLLETAAIDNFELNVKPETIPRLGTGTPTEYIMEYEGHGTCITGVVQRVAPAARVRVFNDLKWAGATTEDDLRRALTESLCREPDIISLSAGGRTHKCRPHLGLDPFYDDLKANGKTLLVAAAGNEGGTDEFWPAAYAGRRYAVHPPAVVSVGALREDGLGRACFSNFGPWVTVFEAGERLVNAFPNGNYRYVDAPALRCRYHDPALYCPCTCVTAPPQHARVSFDNSLARWSGTSFATPYVAARIAVHMKKTGAKTARSAAADLLDNHRECIHDAADAEHLHLLRAG